jgi:drug/metabolite transporter (DMT)-like permease
MARAGEATGLGGEVAARLMLVLTCLIWGITWPMMKIALNGIPPLSMRTITTALGALTLLVFCLVTRRSLRLPNTKAWGHLLVISLLNITAFSLFSAFAQITAATSRVAILTYTMPIWTVLLAWMFLRERPSVPQMIATAVCVLGLAILIYPLTAAGLPLGALLAIGAGLSWAAGTVYVKWARVEADPIGTTGWQLIFSFIVIAACLFVVDGRLDLDKAHASAVAAVIFTGVVGTGLAYALWFEIVRRLPASTAALGSLGSPVIGVVATVLIIGERPTVADMIGFALIFAASAAVVLGPQTRLKPTG